MDSILIAFANSRADFLPKLSEEDEKLYSLLNRTLSDRYKIVRESFAIKKTLGDRIRESKEDMCIFLYSGHAGSDALLLDDESAGAEGLADLLVLCPKLRLVILNGCNTLGQVKRLLELKVPAVIATSDFINDDKAVQFSNVIFEKMANLSTLEKAFEEAKAAVWDDSRNIEIHRGLGGDWLSGGEEKEDPWGLYVGEGREDVLQWQLQRGVVPVDPNFRPNVALIEAMLEGLVQYNNDAKELFEQGAGNPDYTDDKCEVILTALPKPISDQFSRLIVQEGDQLCYEMGLARLAQLVHTYDAITELIALTFLAQLWEVAIQEDTVFDPEEVEPIRSYMLLSEKESGKYKFTSLIRAVRMILSKRNEEYFVEELAALAQKYTENKELKEALDFIEDLKSRMVDGSVLDGESRQLCALMEEHLSVFVKEIGFLAKYKLTSIKNIDVLKYRHTPVPKYKYEFVVYEQRLSGVRNRTDTRPYLLDRQSVLITKPEAEGKFLNLSPFIMDENAFQKATMEKLMVFRNYSQSEDAYYFKSIYKPKDPPIRIDGKGQFGIIKEQFEAFAQLIFKKSMSEL
jgi:hypothetical protein